MNRLNRLITSRIAVLLAAGNNPKHEFNKGEFKMKKSFKFILVASVLFGLTGVGNSQTANHTVTLTVSAINEAAIVGGNIP